MCTNNVKCVRLGYLRDCRAWPKYHIATITAEGAKVGPGIKYRTKKANVSMGGHRIQ